MKRYKRYKYILKIDVDIHLPKKHMEVWVSTRKAILESLGFKVKQIIIRPSSKRGFHAWLHFLSNKKIKSEELCLLQIIAGSDIGREKINMVRLNRGVQWQIGNKLFDKIIWRRDKNFERNRLWAIFKKIKRTDTLDRREKIILEKDIKRLLGLEELYRRIMTEGQEEILKVK